jgi:hypothetical protein
MLEKIIKNGMSVPFATPMRAVLYRGSYYAVWQQNGTIRRRALRTKNLVEATAALDTFSHKPAPRAEPNRVYFIMCGKFVKIGIAADPELRMANMQNLNPYPLSLVGTMEGGASLEAELHNAFSEYHHSGEWFLVHGKLAKYLRSLAERHRPGA